MSNTHYVTGSSDKSRGTALALCVIGGMFGLHQFYVGRIGKGVLYACTMGLFGFGWIGDILKILNRSFTDNVGNPLRH
ncbi:MAG: TM2 domain-containing protein [Clostridia bacterium]|nr:TM2 domain-containing protein [Clostridia bacterium]